MQGLDAVKPVAEVKRVDAVQSHDTIVEVLNVQHLCRYPHVRGGAPTADC